MLAALQRIAGRPVVGDPGTLGWLALRVAAGAAFILHAWGRIQQPFGSIALLHLLLGPGERSADAGLFGTRPRRV